jgi:hypothetical protein
MPKLTLNVAELNVTSFDALPVASAREEWIGYTTIQACTYPKYSCLIACPSQRAED